VEKNQNIRFMLNGFLFRRSCRLWDNVAKCDGARLATDDNIMRCSKDAICMGITKARIDAWNV